MSAAADAARRPRNAERRRRARRQAIRRRRATALLSIAAIALACFFLLSAPSKAPPRAHRGSSAATRHVPPAQPLTRALPQTTLPTASSPQFKTEMADLWKGVVHNSLRDAMPAFFPETAYERLKALADPAADFKGRLVHDFSLDIGAAHALLGSDAGHARLLGVRVVASYAHWVPAGVCANSIGYFEMPNARVVYREAGAVRSFGIASMISWEGVWYVVHFGAILRATDSGQVDDAASGPGVSAYSGTC
ncbi:MAG TPA: hypothetical protein VID68_07835 [Solirubrobacteraceae bacterium]|jgi:hypothetical protein